MDQLTCDIPGVADYLDDILLHEASAEQHIQNLRSLLQRLQDKGLTCALEKCAFAQPSVEYLGHTLSCYDAPKGPKVDAVVKMPAPTDLSWLRSFLESVRFYAKFTSNLSTPSEPIHQLCHNDAP